MVMNDKSKKNCSPVRARRILGNEKFPAIKAKKEIIEKRFDRKVM